jgi:hypothetical protein
MKSGKPFGPGFQAGTGAGTGAGTAAGAGAGRRESMPMMGGAPAPRPYPEYGAHLRPTTHGTC